MEKDKNQTLTKFLIHPTNGDLIAYFPYQIANFNGYRYDNKVCYSHIGQHSSCNTSYATQCRYATPEEYKELLAELESIGYNIKLAKGNRPKKNK